MIDRRNDVKFELAVCTKGLYISNRRLGNDFIYPITMIDKLIGVIISVKLGIFNGEILNIL
jgi:hypothetical protein